MVLDRSSSRGWWLTVVSVALAAIAIAVAHHRVSALQFEQRDLFARRRALAMAQSEKARLVAGQPTAVEWAKLNRNHDAVLAARTEATALRARVERLERQSGATAGAADKGSAPAVASSLHLVSGAKVPIADCHSVGNESPPAALETALWAGAGGNVSAFANTLLFLDSSATRAATELLARMPENIRAECTTPEQLIAFLTVKDIPTTEIRLRECAPVEGMPFSTVFVSTSLRDTEGKWIPKTLLFANKGDGWKLVVTKEVVMRYAATFSAGQTTGAGR